MVQNNAACTFERFWVVEVKGKNLSVLKSSDMLTVCCKWAAGRVSLRIWMGEMVGVIRDRIHAPNLQFESSG